MHKQVTLRNNIRPIIHSELQWIITHQWTWNLIGDLFNTSSHLTWQEITILSQKSQTCLTTFQDCAEKNFIAVDRIILRFLEFLILSVFSNMYACLPSWFRTRLEVWQTWQYLISLYDCSKNVEKAFKLKRNSREQN